MESFNDYEVNIDNLRYNVNHIHRFLNSNIKMCAVVKANAYGVGIKEVVNAIKDQVDFFAVANVIEAKEVRELCKNKILILSVVHSKYINWCSLNNVSILVSNLSFAEFLIKQNMSINVHIKINTGLNRIGFNSLKDCKKVVKLFNNSKIVIEGAFTHFATKNNDTDFIEQQFIKFKKYLKLFNKNIIFHCCNSYATNYLPKYHMDMVRFGYCMYGLDKLNYGFYKQVLKITSQIVDIHKIKRGETIGYDRTFKANKNMTIGVVPLGYADGLNRRLSNRFSLIVNNHYCPIVGNICMDVCMIDITNIYANIGDQIIILGTSENCKLTLNKYAKVLQTSPYEILLNFRYDRMNYKIIDSNKKN